MSEKMLIKPGPHPTRVSQPFWDAAGVGQLLLQRCQNCKLSVFYPREQCPHCWSSTLDWYEASGRGVIASFIGVYKPGHPAFIKDVPYVVALVDLEEGPRMLSNIVNCSPDESLIGRPVEVVFEAQGSVTLPKFRTIEEASS
jgi:uncharacterized OB-fold protein